MRNVWDLELGHMSEEHFRLIVAQVAEMEEKPLVFFGGFGEPLFHPHALEYMRRIRETGAEIDLITNGTMLTEARIEELIDMGLRRIWVSIDGAKPESYADVRLGASLPQVLSNLETLRKRKLRLAKTAPELGIAFVAMERNIADLPRVVELGLRLGAEHFSISNVIAHSERMKGETLYEEELRKWNPKRAQVELSRMDLDDERVTSALKGLMETGSRALGIPELELFPVKNRCPFIEKGSMSIRWDGAVSPCLSLLHSHDFYLGEAKRRSHAYQVGTVGDRPLLEIWNDPEYLDLRERIDDFRFSPCTTCRSCERIDQNLHDCQGNDEPACGGCLWAQGLIRCP
jgi:MoaA/NifB/PqqE/SkfB family radical SAM enzyme